MSDSAPRRRRLLPRFSLRSLILFVLLAGSGYGLWARWSPWYQASSWTCPEPGYHGAKLSSSFKKMLVFSHEISSVSIIDLETNTQVFTRKYPGGVSPALSSDGRLLYVYNIKLRELEIRRTSDGGLVQRRALSRSTSSRNYYLLQRNEILFYQDLANGSYRIRNVSGDDREVNLKSGSGESLNCTISPTGRWAVTANADGSSLLWDLSDNKVHSRPLITPTVETYAQFSPDERFVATWREETATRKGSFANETEKQIYVWNTMTGELIAKLPGDAETVAFYDDSKLLAAASFEGAVIQFWDLADKRIRKSVVSSVPSLVQESSESRIFVFESGLYEVSSLDLLASIPILKTGNESVAAGSAGAGLLVTSTFPLDPHEPDIYNKGHRIFRTYRRRRPEYWWGVAWLPEFWLTAVLGVGLVVSVWRDLKGLHAAPESPRISDGPI